MSPKEKTGLPKFKRDDLTKVLEIIKKNTGKDVDGRQVGFLCKIMSKYAVSDIMKCCESLKPDIDTPVTFLSYLLRRDYKTNDRIPTNVEQFWKT